MWIGFMKDCSQVGNDVGVTKICSHHNTSQSIPYPHETNGGTHSKHRHVSVWGAATESIWWHDASTTADRVRRKHATAKQHQCCGVSVKHNTTGGTEKWPFRHSERQTRWQKHHDGTNILEAKLWKLTLTDHETWNYLKTGTNPYSRHYTIHEMGNKLRQLTSIQR